MLIATPICTGSNVTKLTGAGSRVGGGEVNGVGRLGRAESAPSRGAVETPLVERHDVEVIPREADRILQVGPQHRLVREAVDRRQGLGQRHRRRAPDRVALQGVEHDGALRAIDGERQQRARVEHDGHPRSSRNARSIRTPDQIATGGGGRHSLVRRGATSEPDARSCSSTGAALVERSELGDRPSAGRHDRPLAVAGAPYGLRELLAQGSHSDRRRTGVHTRTQADLRRRRKPDDTPAMNFAFTEEQDELRNTVRAFLESKSAESAVREQMETEAGYDDAVWRQMAEQMGLQGLHIPEAYGGSGFGYVELGIVLEEMGRALLCAPFFSSVVLAANTLIQSGDEDAKQKYLPGIASGETIATLAYTEPSGKWDEAGITMQASGSGDSWTLTGEKMFVVDGHTANLIIVAARTERRRQPVRGRR